MATCPILTLPSYGFRCDAWTLSQHKDHFPWMEILTIKIRLSWNRFIFVMGIPLLVRRYLYTEASIAGNTSISNRKQFANSLPWFVLLVLHNQFCWIQVIFLRLLHWHWEISSLTLKWLSHFCQNVISFSDAAHLMCNIFIWNWSNTMNV